jgi:predicted DNA-binding transcriptional regulator AlpA
MAEADNQRRGGESADEKLYTLSEISQRTGISMPTLQRYKKMYQDRLPSVGKGRKQRYPESALPVFDEIKTENAGRRGRPRKDASAPRPERATASKRRPGRPAKKTPAVAAKRPGRPAKKATAARAAASGRKTAAASGRAGGRAQKSGNLLTLTQISEQTGISYPTLVRYVRINADRLPSEGKGRARRFYPQAVDVFRQLRQESGRGGRKAGSSGAAAKPAGRGRGRAAAAASGGESNSVLQQRLKALEKTQQNLEKKLKGFVDSISKLFR